jgi:DNA-binding MltR family transcriptional regulator
MPPITEKNELDAYYLSDPTDARAAGVMWPAIVERRIDRLFETALRPEMEIRRELFRPSGALGNYAVKVRLAYLLGWVGKDVYHDLILISKIRNRFAHSIEAKDFTDQKIESWLKDMNGYRVTISMAEQARKRATSDPSRNNQTLSYIATNIAAEQIRTFRFCMDLLISHLDSCRENMENNLSSLPGNWLVILSPDQKEKTTDAKPGP